MSRLIKWICLKETNIYNVGSEDILKAGSIVEVLFFPTMIYYKNHLSYLNDGDLEANFMSLAEWREKQINSILDD